MDTQEEELVPEVSTEPQRRALDEMSRQLVERLNAMVHEQNERAEHFAATQHSLSALPNQQIELPGVPGLDLPETAIPDFAPAPEYSPKPAPLPTVPPAQKGKKEHKAPPPLTTQRKEPQEFFNKPLRERKKQDRKPVPALPDGQKSEESGCGSGTVITLIIIVLIILRACT